MVVGLRPWQRVGLWGCGDGRSSDGRMDLVAEQVWNGASGRLLLAQLPARQRRLWLEHVGLPAPGQWPGIATSRELLTALAEIRRAGHSISAQADGTVAVAVPLPIEGGHVAVGCHHRGRRPAPWVLPELVQAAAAVRSGLG